MTKHTRRALFLAAVALLAALAWQPLQRAYQAYTLQHLFTDGPLLVNGPGPAVGSQFPGLRARDGEREVTLLNDYRGARGTVLVVLGSVTGDARNAAQLRQLQQHSPRYRDSGIGLVVLVQDAAAPLRQFVQRNRTTLALLRDDDRLSVRTLGLASATGGSEDTTIVAGALVIDRQNTVRRALFPVDSTTRLDSAFLLAQALEALSPQPG